MAKLSFEEGPSDATTLTCPLCDASLSSRDVEVSAAGMVRCPTCAARWSISGDGSRPLTWIILSGVLLVGFFGLASAYRARSDRAELARAVAVLDGFVPAPGRSAPPPTLAGRRDALASADGTATWPCQGGAASTGLCDVAWDVADQSGYLRVDRLEVNDPESSQYQLWILDGDRDPARPVSCGVFDVPIGGELIVPIVPQVQIGRATAFLVTVEEPGGVVVSARDRVALIVEVGP